MRPKNNRMNEARELAAVGIGTMIVFIATVLVAAIAAGVLIDMSGKLQSRSSSTGEAATTQVASNLKFNSILGIRNNTGQTNVIYLNIYVELAPGASSVDLGETRVQLTTKDKVVMLNYTQNPVHKKDRFDATEERDNDNSFSTASPVLSSGDLVVVNITLPSQGITLDPRSEVNLALIPEAGSKAATEFTTPSSYSARKVIPLS